MIEIAPYLPGILLTYGVVSIGLLSPGPNIMSVVGTAMGVGRREARALAYGIATGSLLWAMLTWFGLVSLITAYASLMTVIKFAGAGYLLWLAFKAFRSAARAEDEWATAVRLSGEKAYFRRGLLVQMSNPKAAFSWIATMSLGLAPDAPIWVGIAIIIGTTLLSFLGHFLYATAFSTPVAVRAYRRARRYVEAGLGAFFCFASYKLMTTKM